MTESRPRAEESRRLWVQERAGSLIVKVALLAALNLLAFWLAWQVNGKPQPDLTQWPWDAYLTMAPLLARPLVRMVMTLIGTFLNWDVLRYLLPINLMAVIPFLGAARFVQRLYGMDNYFVALEYLFDAMVDPSFYFLDPRDEEQILPPGFGRGQGPGRVAMIKDGVLTPAGGRARNRTIAWAGGPGNVIIPPEHAAQLERGGRLSRVVGPSVARLHRFERVYKVINLRQIVRSATVIALTRDGIPVTVEVTVHSRIRQPAEPPPPSARKPFAFDEKAVNLLSRTTMFTKSGPRPWEDRAINLAPGTLNVVVAKYRLDEVFEPLDNSADPRLAIQDEVRARIRQMMEPAGIEVTEVWLGEFQLSPAITEQYVEFWRAERQRRDRAREAEGRASAIRQIGRARAQAQQQIIQALVASFQASRQATPSVPPKQLLALRLIDSLEQLYRQSGREDHAQQLDHSLSQLRKTIQGGRTQPEEG